MALAKALGLHTAENGVSLFAGNTVKFDGIVELVDCVPLVPNADLSSGLCSTAASIGMDVSHTGRVCELWEGIQADDMKRVGDRLVDHASSMVGANSISLSRLLFSPSEHVRYTACLRTL